MDKKYYYLRMSDGQHVYVRTYKPSGEIKGYMHILHGLAEHSGRYNQFADEMGQLGYFVSMHDHRGHGYTADDSGEFGFFAQQDGFARVVEDAHEVIEHIQHEDALPVPILFGHSMGSFIARRYVQLHSEDVAALILSGTGAYTAMHAVGQQLATVLAAVAGKDTPSELMNDLSFSNFNKSIVQPATAFDWLSHDAKAVQAYIDDPMCGFVATHQLFADLTQGISISSKPREVACIRPDLPVLLISGDEDPVGGFGKGVYKVGRQLQEAGVDNVCVYLFEGMRHEILNEINKEYVYQIIKRWLTNGKKI